MVGGSFLDLDDAVAAASGACSVQDAFVALGEQAFRAVEAALVRRLAPLSGQAPSNWRQTRAPQPPISRLPSPLAWSTVSFSRRVAGSNHPDNTAMTPDDRPSHIRVVFLDFGGVLAREGFFNGLHELALHHGLDPDYFFRQAVELVYGSGYLVGQADEADFWRLLREDSGVNWDDATLRELLLSRFELRPRMFEFVDRLRDAGVKTAILSDQTNWLDELEAELGFFKRFDRVFNSYHEGLHKRQPECFERAVAAMGVEPSQALFVDDAARNVALAQEVGLQAIHFTNENDFFLALERDYPELAG